MLVVRRAALVAEARSGRKGARRSAERRATLSTYTVAAIEDGDDANGANYSATPTSSQRSRTSDELAEAFVKRMDQQTVEISRLGVPEGDSPEIWTYAAHLFSHEDPAVLATARVAVWPRVEINDFRRPTAAPRRGVAAIDATLLSSVLGRAESRSNSG